MCASDVWGDRMIQNIRLRTTEPDKTKKLRDHIHQNRVRTWLVFNLNVNVNNEGNDSEDQVNYQKRAMHILPATTTAVPYSLVFTTTLQRSVIICSLHAMHKINACRAEYVCPSICLYDSTGEPLDRFGRNFVYALCHWRLT